MGPFTFFFAVFGPLLIGVARTLRRAMADPLGDALPPKPAASTPPPRNLSAWAPGGEGRHCPGAHHSATSGADASSNRTCAAGTPSVPLSEALPPLDPVDKQSVGVCERCGTVAVRYRDGAVRCACGRCDLPPALVRARESADTLASLNALYELPARVPAHERRSA